MNNIYTIESLNNLDLKIKTPCLIFLNWDLGSWKTTLTKHILNDILWVNKQITSPTYTYYNKYNDIYHFDLYRLKSYDEFFSIWGEDILDNNDWVVIVEWPDLIKAYYKPDIEININKAENDLEREFIIKNIAK